MVAPCCHFSHSVATPASLIRNFAPVLKIAISSTNPCHLYEMAVALTEEGSCVDYYSGYPAWKLGEFGNDRLRVISKSFRTLVTYGMLRIPENLRPKDGRLFEWQDDKFDQRVAKALRKNGADVVHAMPGQSRETFRECRRLGIPAMLNHASGPIRTQRALIEAEYERVGIRTEDAHRFNSRCESREQAEIALADFHCVASSIVKSQLTAEGVDPDRIFIVPYGADPVLFPKRLAAPAGQFRICFAGQLSLRKGIKTLLDSLEHAGEPDWQCQFYGRHSSETAADFGNYRGATEVGLKGSVSRMALADAMRASSVLVLPSWEEAFGLVVPQALQSGVPCIVSDRVGAADLIRHRSNGSVFPAGDSEALLEELRFWESRPSIVTGDYTWQQPARLLQSITEGVLA